MSQAWPRLALALLGGGAFFFAQEMESWLFRQKSPALGIGTVAFSAVSLSYLLLATRRTIPKWVNTYVLATSLLVLSLYSAIQILALPYSYDTTAVTHYAAEQLAQGRNPYANFEMQEVLKRFGLGLERATVLEDGSIENRLNYPAGSFLFLAPFVALGVSDTRLVYLLCLVAMILVLHHYAEATIKNVVVLYAMTNLALLRYTYAGLPEPLWALPMLVAWVAARNRTSSPVALGLATAVKQLAWFAVPFYLVMSFHEFGFRETARRLALVLGVFVAINLPFVVLSPREWATGIAAPMMDPLAPIGGGLVALSTSGVLPLFPRAVYTALEMLALLAALVWYFRSYWGYKSAGVLLSTLPLWFAWRSLLGYFYMSSFLLLGLIVRERYGVEPETKRSAVEVG